MSWRGAAVKLAGELADARARGAEPTIVEILERAMAFCETQAAQTPTAELFPVGIERGVID